VGPTLFYSVSDVYFVTESIKELIGVVLASSSSASVIILLTGYTYLIKILTIIQTEVRSNITVKSTLSEAAFTRIERLEPRRPPTNAAAARGNAAITLKEPLTI
jgi:hypothetical protein